MKKSVVLYSVSLVLLLLAMYLVVERGDTQRMQLVASFLAPFAIMLNVAAYFVGRQEDTKDADERSKEVWEEQQF